jgi:hypothetical protein
LDDVESVPVVDVPEPWAAEARADTKVCKSETSLASRSALEVDVVPDVVPVVEAVVLSDAVVGVADVVDAVVAFVASVDEVPPCNWAMNAWRSLTRLVASAVSEVVEDVLPASPGGGPRGGAGGGPNGGAEAVASIESVCDVEDGLPDMPLLSVC